MAAAYDPDHVVVAEGPLPELMRIDAETHRVKLDGRLLEAHEVETVLPNQWAALSPHDDAARNRLARACSAFRSERSFSPGDEPLYDHTRLPRNDDSRLGNPQRDLVNVPLPASTEPINFADAELRLGAAWLAGFGAVGVAEQDDQMRMEYTVSEMADRIRHLVSMSERWIDWTSQPEWEPSLRGLTPLLHFRARDLWIVVGDTLNDFALAHCLSRMCGGAWWIPAAWLQSGSPFKGAARAIVSRARNSSRSDQLFVTSTSLDPTFAWSLCTAPEISPMMIPAHQWAEARGTEAITGQFGGLQLALARDYDRDLALPVHVSPNGDRVLVNPLQPQVPETPAVFDDPQLDWVIDVSFSDHDMPRGRWLDPEFLQSGDDRWRERVRSGREGLAIMASSYGFVPAGATPRQRTARPRLVAPSLSSWAEQMAITSGMQLKTSEAGHLSSVAARLWGDRRPFVDDLSRFLPAFYSFVSTKDKSADRYPSEDGVVLRREGPQGFPTFQAIAASLSELVEDAIAARRITDRLIEVGAFRRGLIVLCQQCALVQFTRPTSVDFRTECARCGAAVALTQSAWKKPPDEPTWFYDLHPTLRRMLKDHGEVPLLAEAVIARTRKRLTGLPELELHGPSGLQCEIDVLCGDAEYVVVGEAKTTPVIPADQVKKKVKALTLAAQVFRADQVLLAAGDPGEWDRALVDRLRASLQAQDWPSGAAPALRLMSGLRTASVVDTVVD